MHTISNNDIAKAIYLAGKDKAHAEHPQLFKNIVHFLNRKRLLAKSPDILLKLNKIVNREGELLEVKVSSAQKLTGGDEKELTHFLKKRYGAKEIIFISKVDENLIGGVKIEVNDEVIDLTIKNKIAKLKEHLTRKI